MTQLLMVIELRILEQVIELLKEELPNMINQRLKND